MIFLPSWFRFRLPRALFLISDDLLEPKNVMGTDVPSEEENDMMRPRLEKGKQMTTQGKPPQSATSIRPSSWQAFVSCEQSTSHALWSQCGDSSPAKYCTQTYCDHGKLTRKFKQNKEGIMR
jgi:hypothetical protein